jgi:hypothetical protein
VAPATGDDPRLRGLYDADQADRAGGDLVDGADERDAARRAEVLDLLAAGQARTAADAYHAAMVLQHGRGPDDYALARDLAAEAAASGEPRARWLTAAATDRWLMSLGRPQRYGTQWVEAAGRTTLYPVDPTTTDAERLSWDVAPLDELRRRPPGPPRK